MYVDMFLVTMYIRYGVYILYCYNMSTPSMVFTIWMKNILMVLWLLWVSTLVISRIYILHEAYNFETAKLIDELYLLKLCKVINPLYHLI
jgi:hypothetical protein